MKNYLFSFVLSFLLSVNIYAISPPKPLKGSPGIFSPNFSASSGPYVYYIDLPPKWGIGNMSVSAEGGYFELFPNNGGVGSTIEITLFESNEQAAKKLQKLRDKFKDIKKFENGFEVELSKAFYSASVDGEGLIQIWYSLPKKNKDHKKIWKKLKNSISISKHENATSNIPEPINKEIEQPTTSNEALEPITKKPVEKTGRGWVFNHPSSGMSVFFDTIGAVRTALKEDDRFSYLLQFDDTAANAIGYFYVEWDQSNLNTADPYQRHIDKIALEIQAIEPSQTFETINLELENGFYAILGNPYSIISIAKNGTLFGFAAKKKSNWQDIDIDLSRLLDRVKWSDPNAKSN